MSNQLFITDCELRNFALKGYVSGQHKFNDFKEAKEKCFTGSNFYILPD